MNIKVTTCLNSTTDIRVMPVNALGIPKEVQKSSINIPSYLKARASTLQKSFWIEIHCTEFNYAHHVKLLKRLYLSKDSIFDTWDAVGSALGILQVAAALQSEEIVCSCVRYLEAVPWIDGEEDEILEVVSQLGEIAMPILKRIQPIDLNATKSVLISAIRFSTSIDGPCLPFRDEIRISAQEQVDYMLGDDEDMLLITDNEVKSETIIGLSNIFSLFERELFSSLESDEKIMSSLSDLEWLCNILLKMGLMNEFVIKWIDISGNVIKGIEENKFEHTLWVLKLTLLEVTSKVLDAVGYGNVILPAPLRVKLLKLWLPFIRKFKAIMDSMIDKDKEFPYKMDEDMCQGIEGAIVSIVSALPSDDQADILADWMSDERLRYPDLSEAFEVWCYRTKSAKRRLIAGSERVENATVGL